MRIQGRKLKGDREPQKTVLNEFSKSRTIVFWENETRDRVDVVYLLGENDRGFYSQEYRPDTVAKEDAKIIDITAFVINEEKRTCRFKLCDVKKDVGGEDVVRHLCQQWQASYQYLYHSVLAYLDDDTDVQGELGAITRNFDVGRIEKELNSLKEKLEKLSSDQEKPQMLARRKGQMALPALREMTEFLEKVLQGKISFRMAGRDVELPVKVYHSTYREPEEYYCRLLV